MKNLFVPYELALELKNKGFNEPCLAYYGIDFLKLENNDISLLMYERYMQGTKNSSCHKTCISAPLYQQVVDWLREYKSDKVKDINIYLYPNPDAAGYNWSIDYVNRDKLNHWQWNGIRKSTFDSYYEALNKVIKKALELI